MNAYGFIYQISFYIPFPFFLSNIMEILIAVYIIYT